MYRTFSPVEVDDTDGENTRVEVGTDAKWRHCVKLTARACMTFDQASNYLDPAGARAVAAALLEAADEADCRQQSEDAADAAADELHEQAKAAGADDDPEPVPAVVPAEGDVRITPGGVAYVWVNGMWRQTVIDGAR
jgi:hypothetical protein